MDQKESQSHNFQHSEKASVEIKRLDPVPELTAFSEDSQHLDHSQDTDQSVESWDPRETRQLGSVGARPSSTTEHRFKNLNGHNCYEIKEEPASDIV